MMSIPGLALFYAGMVRKKNILAAMAAAQPVSIRSIDLVLKFCALLATLYARASPRPPTNLRDIGKPNYLTTT